MDNIYNQNDLADKQTLEQVKKEMEPIFRTGPRDKPYCHWVVEVTPAVRREIMSKGRIYVGYGSCRVDDFVSVTRCYKC